MNMALNNRLRLICHKIQTNKLIKSWHSFINAIFNAGYSFSFSFLDTNSLYKTLYIVIPLAQW